MDMDCEGDHRSGARQYPELIGTLRLRVQRFQSERGIRARTGGRKRYSVVMFAAPAFSAGSDFQFECLSSAVFIDRRGAFRLKRPFPFRAFRVNKLFVRNVCRSLYL